MTLLCRVCIVAGWQAKRCKYPQAFEGEVAVAASNMWWLLISQGADGHGVHRIVSEGGASMQGSVGATDPLSQLKVLNLTLREFF